METDDLNPKYLWVIVCRKLEDPKSPVIFRNPTESGEFLEFAKGVTQWIGHNIINFDWPVLQKFFPGLKEPVDGLLDTLVISRLIDYPIKGGHSLDAWGARLGEKKIEFHNFSRLSDEMVEYCAQDTLVNWKLYEHFKRYIDSPLWKEAIQNEHRTAILCEEMSKHGFWFDYDTAMSIRKEMIEHLRELDAIILRDLKPRAKLIREITPRETKHGTLNASDFRFLPRVDGGLDLSRYSADAPFSLIEWVPFNPGSPKQMVERLNEAGWKPFEKTDKHIEESRKRGKDRDPDRLKHFGVYGWKVNEANLSTLPDSAPEGVKKLAERLTLNARLSDLDEWLAVYNPKTHRIHGSFMHIGSWTHRMAHHRPNTGNIASAFPTEPKTAVERIKALYDGRMRALWGVPPGHLQIGVDMESAHLRILAHLMNDKEFTYAMTSGKKEDGTDPHTLNWKALGEICRSRDDAKTFIYTFLNGGAAAKAATIFGCTVAQAKGALTQFSNAWPGLKKLLSELIPQNANRGYFQGIDGRFIRVTEEHGQLAGILQNAEKIILSVTAWKARCEFLRLNIPAKIINMVHDEIQVELYSDDRAVAQQVGEIIKNGYFETAEQYGLLCPFDGGISIGTNWAGAH